MVNLLYSQEVARIFKNKINSLTKTLEGIIVVTDIYDITEKLSDFSDIGIDIVVNYGDRNYCTNILGAYTFESGSIYLKTNRRLDSRVNKVRYLKFKPEKMVISSSDIVPTANFIAIQTLPIKSEKNNPSLPPKPDKFGIQESVYPIQESIKKEYFFVYCDTMCKRGKIIIHPKYEGSVEEFYNWFFTGSKKFK